MLRAQQGRAGIVTRDEKSGDGRVRLALVGSAFLWGTWWLPLRAIHGLGLGGSLAVSAGFALATLLLAPWVVLRWRSLLTCGWISLACAVTFAAAFAFWSEGLIHGNVARVTLLFYLAPVWGTVLARVVLHEPITWLRWLAIVLGLAGAALLLGDLGGVPLPQDRAEWLGLIGGVFWALALLFVNLSADRPDMGRAFLIVAATAPAYMLVGAGDAPASAVDWPAAAAWLGVFAVVWIIPVVWLTLYGASRMDPGRVAIILILEVVVAIISSAILAGEPFGLTEAVGAVAIIGAGVLESVPGLWRSARRSS